MEKDKVIVGFIIDAKDELGHVTYDQVSELENNSSIGHCKIKITDESNSELYSNIIESVVFFKCGNFYKEGAFELEFTCFNKTESQK